LFEGKNVWRGAHEREQQVKRESRQRDLLRAARHALRSHIDREIANAVDRTFGREWRSLLPLAHGH
jgi:hypothetical protein